MSFQKYMGQVIENQVSDEFFFTEVIDCDKFDALKGKVGGYSGGA